MNRKALSFIKNMSYTISSNLLSLIVSTIVILIVPKLIGVEEYGYWQLYLFYSSYVGFLHLGWNDGIYLRYGGIEYEELDKKLFFSQFLMLFTSQLLIGIAFFILSYLYIDNNDRSFILKMVSIVIVVVNTRYLFLYLLQATNRIRTYAKITMLDRIIYIIVILLLLVVGIRDYKSMIVADLLGKIISLFFSMLSCKEIAFGKLSSFRVTMNEMILNIGSGIKLMFANIASILIIGIVRFGIERTWDVETFGKISLTLSISNMTMVFINAVGIVMFPILRRTNQDRLPLIYSTMRDFLMVILLGVLVAYYPLRTFISYWLPKYSDSLRYMALVFPMFIFEGKMALLINTYLKTLRKENIMLQINLVTMLLSLSITVVTTQVLKNLDLAIISIVLLLAFRSVMAEMYLSKELNVKVKKDVLLELLLTSVFIISGWFINSWYTLFIYSLTYMAYIFYKRKDITNTINNLKLLMKS